MSELAVVVSKVESLIAHAASAIDDCQGPNEHRQDPKNLPWSSSQRVAAGQNSDSTDRHCDARKHLLVLAPLLDRLGRTLVDAAPHIASHAATLPRTTGTESHEGGEEGSNVVIASADVDGDVRGCSSDPFDGIADNEDDADLEPDYVDFVNGVVNTTRGEVRRRQNRQDEVTSLLSAYLAAASLGSLVGDDDGGNGGGGGGGGTVGGGGNTENDGGTQGRPRFVRPRDTRTETGGTGFDIHIHAIVTGPGVGTGGGLGVAVLGDQVGLARPSIFSSSTRRTTLPDPPTTPPSTQSDSEDLGIFADLYSENPIPVNLSGDGVSEGEVASRNEVSRGGQALANDRSTGRQGEPTGVTSSSLRLGASERAIVPADRNSPARVRRGVISRLFRRRRTNTGPENRP